MAHAGRVELKEDQRKRLEEMARSRTLAAILPIAAMLLAAPGLRIPVIAGSALAGLGLLGVAGGHLAQARKSRAALRVLLGGGLAMGVSALIGRLLGVAGL